MWKERAAVKTAGGGGGIVYFHLFPWKLNKKNNFSTKRVLRGGQEGMRRSFLLSLSNKGVLRWRGCWDFVEMGSPHLELPGQLTDGQRPTAVHGQPVLAQRALQGDTVSVLVQLHRPSRHPGALQHYLVQLHRLSHHPGPLQHYLVQSDRLSSPRASQYYLVQPHRLSHHPGASTVLPGSPSHIQFPRSTDSPKSAHRDTAPLAYPSPKPLTANQYLQFKHLLLGLCYWLHTWNHCFLCQRLFSSS